VATKTLPKWLDLGVGFYIGVVLNAFLLAALFAPAIVAIAPPIVLQALHLAVLFGIFGGTIWSAADFLLGWRYRQRSLMIGGTLGVLLCAWFPLLNSLNVMLASAHGR
jgi:hypothetical protein